MVEIHHGFNYLNKPAKYFQYLLLLSVLYFLIGYKPPISFRH